MRDVSGLNARINIVFDYRKSLHGYQKIPKMIESIIDSIAVNSIIAEMTANIAGSIAVISGIND